tara:strand:+ start:11314 stop:11811 length:498 start_codon:yes stop_codon:yes gene_type:complete
MKGQPINEVKWIDRDSIKPNDYNPNRVAGPELKLLKISILEDGWTQPIVINPDNEIVDGFHRWTVSGDKEVRKLTDGKVPVVVTSPKNQEHQKMSTIRHNRARGTHGVLDMAKIIQSMVDSGMSQQEIQTRLQMEPEEVVRLALRVGIPKSDLLQDDTFSQAWSI